MKAARSVFHDSLERDGSMAVFVDDRVVLLSPLASALVSLLPEEGWVDAAELVGPLIESFGAPAGDAHAAVADALKRLEAEGVLRVQAS